MLINCPECGKQISDKAISCPNCGYPINPVKTVDTRSTRKIRNYRRLPNGFGCIRHLQGRRRYPFACYPPTNEYRDDGSAVPRKAIGYYETWQQAYDALSAYNKNPESVSFSKVTFADVYKGFFDEKYVKNKKKTYSENSKYASRFAFEKFESLHNKEFKTLKAKDFQDIIDSSELKHATLELMVFLIKQMYKYAIKNDICEKDYGQFVKINIADDDEKGVPFTEKEIKTLWKHTDNETVRMALILIYTGMRVSELKIAQVDLKNKVIITGVKTDAGKNRHIPIHDKILPFTSDIHDFDMRTFRNHFKDMLISFGMEKAKTGETHTPHDCRHTFSWLGDKYKMDSLSKHIIMGHSLKGLADIEMSKYGHRTDEQLREEINKIKE